MKETESDSLHNDDVDEILEDDGMENEMSGDGQDESSVKRSQEMDERVVDSSQMPNNENSVKPSQDNISKNPGDLFMRCRCLIPRIKKMCRFQRHQYSRLSCKWAESSNQLPTRLP